MFAISAGDDGDVVFVKQEWSCLLSIAIKTLLPAIQVQTQNGFLRAANEIWFSKELNSAYGISQNLNCGQWKHTVHMDEVFGLNEGDEATRETLRFDRWNCTNTKFGTSFKII